MSGFSELLDFFRIEAQCCESHVIHTTTVKDRTRNDARSVRIQRRWDNVTRIGHGAFGEVWLQKSEGDERAVKKLSKYGMEHSGIDYRRELEALTKFNNPRV